MPPCFPTFPHQFWKFQQFYFYPSGKTFIVLDKALLRPNICVRCFSKHRFKTSNLEVGLKPVLLRTLAILFILNYPQFFLGTMLNDCRRCHKGYFLVSVRSDENLHFHGTSNTSKKPYHLQISEIFTSSKNDNFENCRTPKNVFYIFQGLLHFEYNFYILKKVFYIKDVFVNVKGKELKLDVAKIRTFRRSNL